MSPSPPSLPVQRQKAWPVTPLTLCTSLRRHRAASASFSTFCSCGRLPARQRCRTLRRLQAGGEGEKLKSSPLPLPHPVCSKAGLDFDTDQVANFIKEYLSVDYSGHSQLNKVESYLQPNGMVMAPVSGGEERNIAASDHPHCSPQDRTLPAEKATLLLGTPDRVDTAVLALLKQNTIWQHVRIFGWGGKLCTPLTMPLAPPSLLQMESSEVVQTLVAEGYTRNDVEDALYILADEVVSGGWIVFGL